MLDNNLSHSEGNMDEERAIINKIMSSGSPLSEWRVKVHRGIGPGYRKTFVVDDASEEGKYVCAVLNSELARWFTLHPSPPACSKTMSIKDMPVPQIAAAEQRPFIALVDEILEAKASDPQADTSELEEEIDWLVYDLYNLADEETAIIADAFWDGEASEEEEDAALVRAIAEGLKSDRADIEEAKSILRERHEVRN